LATATSGCAERGALAALLLAFAVTPPAHATSAPVAPGAGTPRAAASVKAYWTPARMREALRNSGESHSPTLAWVAGAGARTPAPAHLPGMKAIGRVFSVKPDGQPWSCTGTLIDSPNRSVVWTAGHCLHGGRGGAFHTNLAFAPGYQPQATGNPMPYGLWPAFSSAVAGSWPRKGLSHDRHGRRAWRTSQYDMAGLVLVRDPAGRPAADVVGAAQHIRFRVRKSQAVRMIGYPVAPPYNGETLMQCGPARTRIFRYAVNLMSIPCSLTHGMSGGPALAGMDGAGIGTVIGEMTASDYRRMYVAFQGRESRMLYRHLANTSN
jgi:V8-like Glu-specific endopeptidase